jgi:poly-gamma-glutamate synthesis protein (capsule biosynthesis protein)
VHLSPLRLAPLLLALTLAATLAHAQVPPSTSFTVALGGDVIFDAPIEYVLRTRGLSPDDVRSYDELVADLRAPLSQADLAIVNLETPVGPRVRERSEDRDYPTFAAPPAFLGAIAGLGVDVVTVANNHAYDQGVAGLATTLDHARRAGLVTTGTTDSPGYAVRTVRGARVAIVSLTQGVNHRVERDEPASPRVRFFDEARLGELVSHARAHADVVIVALHFTDTGDHMPTRGMRVWSERAAEAGADLVVGHGPHVPASLAWHEVGDRRVPILHSLGNLLAAMQAEEHAERERAPHVRDSVVVTMRVSLERGRVRVDPPRVSAFWIDDVRSPSGAAPFTRPVAIDARRTDALGARARRLAALFEGEPTPVIEGQPTPTHGGHDAVLTAGTAAPPTPPSATARATAPITTSPTTTTAHTTTSPTSTSPTTTSPTTTARTTTPSATTTTRTTTPSATTTARTTTPSATTTPAGAADRPASAPLGVSFRCGSATETAIDDATLRAWLARMQADRSLELEVVSTRCEGEPASLAERRARRAAGLLAVRGPSRSRFHWRPGPLAPGPPSITATAR